MTGAGVGYSSLLLLVGHVTPAFKASLAWLLIAGCSYADDPVGFATRQLGKPYRSDSSAIGPDAYDCSGLTKAAFDQAGIILPHHAASQAALGSPVDGPFQPGDLLFFDSGSQPGAVAHVGIVEEGITMIDARSSYGVVRSDYTDSYWGRHFLFARRLIGGEDTTLTAVSPGMERVDSRLKVFNLRLQPARFHRVVDFRRKPRSKQRSSMKHHFRRTAHRFK